MSLDRVKDRIRKLLATASDSAATDGEIDNAMRAARALMMAHHLEEDEIRKEQAGVQKEIRFARKSACSMNQSMGRWEAQLGSFVSKFLGSVQAYHQSANIVTVDGRIQYDEQGEPRVAAQLFFYGPDEEVVLALELYEELRHTIVSMARLRYSTPWRAHGREYCEGFVEGLWSKLHQADCYLTNDSKSNALVVRTNQALAVIKDNAQTWLESTHQVRLRRRALSNKRLHDRNSREAGRKDGRSTDVNASRRPKLEG